MAAPWRTSPVISTGRRSFSAWELVGPFPAILDDDTVGAAARDLFADARVMLEQIIAERWYGRGVVGFWPANADGDDIVCGPTRPAPPSARACTPFASRWPRARAGPTWRSPTSSRPWAGPDWIGGFAVTAGHGEAEIARRFKDAGDDYSAILAAALADRLAEAFAEALHHRCAPSSGATRRRALRCRRHDRREVPRDPPRAGLSGPAGPHRKGAPCSGAGRGGGDGARSLPKASP